ncbi:MAG: IS30 family transposase [Gammaproteobacteria bacterium]|nr:IS30 family transposase [Gammaproteobacteria bacterium]
MGRHYHHLQERIPLYELLFEGFSIREIADTIGVHKTTIYRELQRNSSQVGYRPDLAQQSYTQRRQIKSNKLTRNPALRSFVIEKLKSDWSPELIAGYLKRKSGCCVISHETIYRFIYGREGIKLKLYRYLIRRRKFRYPRIKRRRKMMANARKTPIEQRSNAVNQRLHFGHWEGDLILFRKTTSNLITVRERKSRLILAIKNTSQHAKSTADLLIKYMKKKLASTVKTLTLDERARIRGASINGAIITG